jgi:hypothetical protein
MKIARDKACSQSQHADGFHHEHGEVATTSTPSHQGEFRILRSVDIRAAKGSLFDNFCARLQLQPGWLNHIPTKEASMFRNWMKLTKDASMLALESQQVIGLRLMKLALGGRAASREATRMVTEKVAALGEAAVKVATGGTTHAVVKGYRKKVQGNRRRLIK